MQSTNPAITLPAPIRIATANLFNYIEPPGAYYDFENIYSQEQWQKKQVWIDTYLTRSKPDIIGFQEVFSPDALQSLCAGQGLPHFVVLDKPDVEDEFIYSKPVVALASRYPIVSASFVSASGKVAEALGLKEGFSFSRQPLRACIALPGLGECDCYVVHFKSKRPFVETLDITTGQQQDAITELLTQDALGSWGAGIRRGSEAALLYHAMVQQRHDSGRPMLLMGDFNDSLDSDVLGALHRARGRIKADSQALLSHFALTDAFELFRATDHSPDDVERAPTHYYGATGSVLDYIMLSSEFDAENPASLFEVVDYQSHDSHLINPRYELDAYSTDHAPVMITLRQRR